MTFGFRMLPPLDSNALLLQRPNPEDTKMDPNISASPLYTSALMANATVSTEPPLAKQYPILRFFHYEHLPVHLRSVSQPFCALAVHMATQLPRNAETSAMLRKLLEAKDCAVRANTTGDDHPAPKEAQK